MLPDRLAQDLQRTVGELRHERERTQRLMAALDRQNAELDRLRRSAHRESNSRLLAEEALDETRDRLELAVEAAGLALWDWQWPASQLFLTARWGEMVGDVAVDAYWPIADLDARVHPDDVPAVQAQRAALLAGTVQRSVMQHRVRTPSGWLWVENHAMVAEHDSQGKPLRLMGTLADISTRQQAREHSERARAQAEQASRAKSAFLAQMGQAARMPLQTLMDGTRKLADSPLNAEQAHGLRQLEGAAQALQALVAEMDRELQSDGVRPPAQAPNDTISTAPVALPGAPVAPAGGHTPASPQALDLDKLRRRLDGDEATLKQLAAAMRSDLAQRQSGLQRALAARDAAAAVAHAHGLKGSLGSMTAERGARLANGLELAARSGDWTLFERALPLLQAEAHHIDAALAALLGGADEHPLG